MTDKLERSVDDKGFFGHPRGLAVLFGAEAWERFSFYGMRALLILYLTKRMGFSGGSEYALYGAYGALVYALPVLGGWVANRWIGYRNAVLLGGTLMSLGHFVMAIEDETALYAALALLCVGNGFFKPNISSTVGRLYSQEDRRRDRGFTIFYMGINVGALVGTLVSGWLAAALGWHAGFGAAGVGMIIGLVWFTSGQRHLGSAADPDDAAAIRRPVFAGLNILQLVWMVSFTAVPLVALALSNAKIMINGVHVFAAGIYVFLGVMAARERGAARYKIIALMVLMLFHTLFWAGFEQAGSSFNILTDSHVDRELFGWTIPAAIFQMVNPLFIMAFVPVFTLMWRKLDDVNKNPSVPKKFSLGLLQLAAGFWMLNVGIAAAVDGDTASNVALVWLILCYLLHTTGELCLSPIGLSAVTILAPRKWVGFCMGAWFLTISEGHAIGGWIASLTSSGDAATKASVAESLRQYSDVFHQVAISVAAAAGVLLLLSPLIQRLMRDEPPPELPKAQTVE